MAKSHHLAGKGHVWKESGVMTQGKKKVEVANLVLGNDNKILFSVKY